MGGRSDPAFKPDQAGLECAQKLLLRELGEPSGEPLGLPGAMPEEGLGERSALESLAPSVVGGARRLDDPGFLAHMDPPTPWVAWAGAQWAAALNQNLLHPETAPVARELAGVDEVVTSEAAHLSVRKAAALLGLEFRAVPADERQLLFPDALGDLSRSALVLTAGTTVTGAVDPLDGGLEDRAAWCHVDAAWAGPLRLSERHAGMLDGIERADSVAISAHKWLFQPKESAVVLFADYERASEALSFGGSYLAAPNVGLLGSHGATALPRAATLLAWGREGMAARIDACMDIAARLAERALSDARLELFSGPETGVVVWRPVGVTDLAALRDRLEHAFVSLGSAGGGSWLRSVSSNPMADPDLVVNEVLQGRGAVARRPERTRSS